MSAPDGDPRAADTPNPRVGQADGGYAAELGADGEGSPSVPIPPPGVRARTTHAAKWSLLDAWGGQAASLLVFVVLSRLLSPSDFGVLASAALMVAIAQLLVDQGLSRVLVQREALSESQKSTVFWATVALSSGFSVLLVATAPGLAHLVGDSRISNVLQALSLTVVVSAATATPGALLQRDLLFKKLAIRRIGAAMTGGAAGILSAFLGAGVWALVVQVWTAAVLSLIHI